MFGRAKRGRDGQREKGTAREKEGGVERRREGGSTYILSSEPFGQLETTIVTTTFLYKAL